MPHVLAILAGNLQQETSVGTERKFDDSIADYGFRDDGNLPDYASATKDTENAGSGALQFMVKSAAPASPQRPVSGVSVGKESALTYEQATTGVIVQTTLRRGMILPAVAPPGIFLNVNKLSDGVAGSIPSAGRVQVTVLQIVVVLFVSSSFFFYKNGFMSFAAFFFSFFGILC